MALRGPANRPNPHGEKPPENVGGKLLSQNIGGKWMELNLLPEGTAFTAQRRHQPVLIGTSRSCWNLVESRGLDPHTLRCLPASNGCRTPVRLTFRMLKTRARRRMPRRACWRKIERTMLTRLRVPNAFQASPAPRPVNLPTSDRSRSILVQIWRMTEVSIPMPCGTHRVQDGLGRPAD